MAEICIPSCPGIFHSSGVFQINVNLLLIVRPSSGAQSMDHEMLQQFAILGTDLDWLNSPRWSHQHTSMRMRQGTVDHFLPAPRIGSRGLPSPSSDITPNSMDVGHSAASGAWLLLFGKLVLFP